ncbi:MAG: glycosyltransferase family 4 protein [Gammaproteobacteria bacterium]|nr:MAG: glycosyltransferase family 4 protein [Gammaproteobacteria bacterium]
MSDPNKYRLAFVVSMFFEHGGMQRSLLRIARACQARGHTVQLFTGELRGAAPEDIEVSLLDTHALSNTASNDKLASACQRAIKGQNFDCVVGFTKLPGLDVYYAGDPCYAARVDETRNSFYKWLPRYRGLVRQERAVFGADANTEILLFAHQEREKFIRYYATDPARFHMLPPGINRDRLLSNKPDAQDAACLRNELGMAPDERMLLLVGSFFRTKGVDRAIDALACLPSEVKSNTRLVIVGHDDAAPFARLAETLGVAEQVIFTGGREDVARFYFAADVLIHPAYTENTGTTLLEAMVCGLPVLTTANCGFAFHIEKANVGMVCPMPFEQAVLNNQLREMLTSDSRGEWRRNGLRYAESTDLYGLVDEAAEVITQRAADNVISGKVH